MEKKIPPPKPPRVSKIPVPLAINVGSLQESPCPNMSSQSKLSELSNIRSSKSDPSLNDKENDSSQMVRDKKAAQSKGNCEQTTYLFKTNMRQGSFVRNSKLSSFTGNQKDDCIGRSTDNLKQSNFKSHRNCSTIYIKKKSDNASRHQRNSIYSVSQYRRVNDSMSPGPKIPNPLSRNPKPIPPKRRSKSVDILENSVQIPKCSQLGVSESFNEGKTYMTSLPFKASDEKSNVMENKPLLAELAKSVAVSTAWNIVTNGGAGNASINFGSLSKEDFLTKWNPAIDKSGTVYVYSATGTESKWNLPEYEDVSPPSPLSSSPASPIEKYESVKEDMLVWRFSMKEGKKVKKSWATSYARYFPLRKKTAFGKPFGVIVFSKKQSDTKKSESFDLVPPCFIDCHMKKQNSLCLRNGDSTEVQLQAETPAVATEWTKLLFEHDNVQEKNLSSEKEKKISLKSSDKVLSKKDSAPGSPTSPGNPSDEADAVKGIKDTLITFFKRRMQQETLAKKGIYKDTVFGSTIAEICLKEQLNTPLFVLQVIRNIERDRENFLIDGLYRISGNASRIQKIRIEVGQNRYGILEEEKDVHNLTGSLKLFFRELKEPLIPFTHYQAFIQATDHLKSKSRPEAIRQAVKKLPHNNRETLKIVLDHLLKVNEFESDNRMSIMNLAIVFGPCLLWPAETTGLDLMTDAMLHNRVVEALLSDFQFVFKKR